MTLPRDRCIGAWTGWLLAIGLRAGCPPLHPSPQAVQATVPAQARSGPVQVTVLAFTDWLGSCASLAILRRKPVIDPANFESVRRLHRLNPQ